MRLRNPRILRSAGFSLVEILLVIVIILMLAGAVVVFVLPQQEGAARNTTRIKLESINSALLLYKTNIGTYPTEEHGGLTALTTKPSFQNPAMGDRWAGPYLKAGSDINDAWGNPIQYRRADKTLNPGIDGASPTGLDYELFSLGPDARPDTEDDVKLVEATAKGGGAPAPSSVGGTTAPTGGTTVPPIRSGGTTAPPLGGTPGGS